MPWALVALGGYLCMAFAALLDKYLLSDRHLPAPAAYAFFVGLFSLVTLFFTPFGFHILRWQPLAIFLLSGALYLYGLVALYAAVKRSEISRVSPLAGTVTAVVTLSAPFLPFLFQEPGAMTQAYFFGLLLLISGGLLLSFDLPLRKEEKIPGFVLLAGLGMGAYFLLLKYGYTDANFVSGLVWSRLGMVIGAFSLLAYPPFRREILFQGSGMAKAPRAAAGTAAVFIINKACAGIGSFLIVLASYLGSVAFVQALSGMQYVFLLILAWPLSKRYPRVFEERFTAGDWLQKACAIILIALGFWLASGSGGLGFFL